MSQVEELNLLRTWGFEGYAHDSEWPQVADAVIEAYVDHTVIPSERHPGYR